MGSKRGGKTFVHIFLVSEELLLVMAFSRRLQAKSSINNSYLNHIFDNVYNQSN